jgi:hypothetical protein
MISLTEDGYGKPVMWVPRGPTESPVFIDRVASGGRLDGSDADSQRAGLQRLLEDVMKIEEDRIWNAMYSMAGTGYGKPSLDLARVDEYDRWIESPRDPNFLMGQPEDLGIGISLGGYQFKIARNSAVVWHDSGATICASGTRKNVCRWRTYEEGEVV